jgi:hypothetical protein
MGFRWPGLGVQFEILLSQAVGYACISAGKLQDCDFAQVSSVYMVMWAEREVRFGFSPAGKEGSW